MIDQLKPYPKYKDSGVAWLGEVPAHWEVERLKSAATNVVHQTTERRPNDLYVALEHVESWTGRLRAVSDDVAFDSQVKRFRAGDVLFGKLRPYLAKVTRPNADGVCVGEFLVLRTRGQKASAEYLERLLRSKPVIDAVNSSTFGAKMPRADWHFVGGMRITVPPLPEQTAIVRFLDYVDRRVRRVIRARRRLVALLGEYRQALIQQAVTGQIDVRTGRPYPKYKDAGVEWLGRVPKHWEVTRLRNVVKSVTSGSRGWSSYAADEGPLFIRIANLSRKSLDLRFRDVVRLNLPDTSEKERTQVHPGDILLSITAYIGSVAVVPDDFEEAYVSQHVARCALRNSAHKPRWLGYVLLSEIGQIHGRLSLYGGTKDGLSLDDVKNYPVLLPPLPEQIAIVEYLDVQTGKIDRAIEDARREIELLKEFRTRLIADVVTGKLDVRAAAARLPETDPLAEDEAPDDADAEDGADGIEGTAADLIEEEA
ncbi:restriction endonuclease subunit S [Rhodocaloribacter sp.]